LKDVFPSRFYPNNPPERIAESTALYRRPAYDV
jgi:hypothetical protein